MANWFYSFILAVFIFLLARYFRFFKKSWLHPGSFFALAWSVYTVAPLVFAPDFDVRPAAILAIFTGCGLVAAGSFLGSRNSYPDSKYASIRLPWLATACIFGGLSGFIAVAIFLSKYHWTLGRIYSWDGLKGLPLFFYTGINVQTPPLLTRCFLLLNYSSVLFGSILWSQGQSLRSKMYSLFPFVPLAFLAIIEGRRARLLVPIFLFVSSFVASEVWRYGGKKPLIRRQSLSRLFFATF